MKDKIERKEMKRKLKGHLENNITETDHEMEHNCPGDKCLGDNCPG